MLSVKKTHVTITILAILMVTTAVITVPPTRAASNISRTKSGLVAQDSLISGNLGFWTIGGDAADQNAPRFSTENSSGLYLGVQALQSGGWIGYYAVTPNTQAYLFHARLTLPYTIIPSDSFNTGLYVQTSKNKINYIACGAGVGAPYTDAWGYHTTSYYWQVVVSSGNSTQAVTYNVLYFQWWWPSEPLTRDCTIITDGKSFVRVYLDGVKVVDQKMSLNMPSPFNAYLEVQTTNAAQMLYGNYTDYYATLSDSIKVTNLPSGATVNIVNSAGNVLASASANSGSAVLSVGAFHFPMSSNIQVYGSQNNLLASTGLISLWGGDVYAYKVSR